MSNRNLRFGTRDVPALMQIATMLVRRQPVPKVDVFRPLVHRPAPLVSVVVRGIGSRDAVLRTLRSIYAQGYSLTQAIVVLRDGDDAAAFESGAFAGLVVVRAEEDDEVRAGFEAAAGEYVVYLPAGDELAEGALERLSLAVRLEPLRVLWFEEAGRGAATPVFGVLRVANPYPGAVAIRRSTYARVGGIAAKSGDAGVRDLWFGLTCHARFVRVAGRLGVRKGGNEPLSGDVKRLTRERWRGLGAVAKVGAVWMCLAGMLMGATRR